MNYIIKKPFMNTKTRQLSISIPKKEFEKLNPKSKINASTVFKIGLAKKKM